MSTTKTLHQEQFDKTIFGFWLYLMTDCVLFSVLFATHAVLLSGTNGAPSGKELFDLPYAFGETLVLLTSSLMCGFAFLSAQRGQAAQTAAWLAITGLLGLAFLGMELKEFNDFIARGASWRASGFLSSFFTLVGTHGAHITAGLIWISMMIYQLLQRGATESTFRRVACLSMFWHFLDVIWIFIFTFVYLMGVI